jgi:GNAT superfamily N-acetyltransferase
MDDELSLHPPCGDPTPYEAAFDAIEGDPRSALYVAECGEGVVGTFQATVLEQLTGRVRQLESVHVHSSVRGRGVGSALMRWALSDAKARGCKRVQLTTQKRRVAAHRFYARLGFSASHEGMKLDI